MERNSIDWTMKENYDGMSVATYSKTALSIQNMFITPYAKESAMYHTKKVKTHASTKRRVAT